MTYSKVCTLETCT